jgi:hypothetical protein
MYEDEQEKTAIISYKELLEAAARIEANAMNEEDLLENDVLFEFNSKKVVEAEETVVLNEETKKFKPTVDISPVFGTHKNEIVEDNEDIFAIEEIVEDENIVENENFLRDLQDFRDNLN